MIDLSRIDPIPIEDVPYQKAENFAADGTIESAELSQKEDSAMLKIKLKYPNDSLEKKSFTAVHFFDASYFGPDFKQLLPTLEKKEQDKYYLRTKAVRHFFRALKLPIAFDAVSLGMLTGKKVRFTVGPAWNDDERSECKDYAEARS